jgi:hypothetical protein
VWEDLFEDVRPNFNIPCQEIRCVVSIHVEEEEEEEGGGGEE